ncbi:MAG: winged helix-turn-helix transcriptional regulator [Candidatus Bathyarchaeota archaeon]
MFKQEILENERRGEIYDFIKKNPGLHLRELQRRLNLPLTSLEYHIDYMVRKNVLLKESSKHYSRYYVRHLDEEDKRILKSLRQKRLREIVILLLKKEKVKYSFLLESLDIPPSTLSFYLKYLTKNKIVSKNKIGYENIYSINERERVAKVLMTYKSSFIDKLVDKTLNTWLETQFLKNPKE